MAGMGGHRGQGYGQYKATARCYFLLAPPTTFYEGRYTGQAQQTKATQGERNVAESMIEEAKHDVFLWLTCVVTNWDSS